MTTFPISFDARDFGSDGNVALAILPPSANTSVAECLPAREE